MFNFEIHANMWRLVGLLLLSLCCMQLQVAGINLELSIPTATRSARLMQFLANPAKFNQNRRVGPGGGPGPVPAAGSRLRPSLDNIRPPVAWRPPAPQHIRREFNNNWPAGGVNQPTRYAHAKDAAVLDVGKNQFYRHKETQQQYQQQQQQHQHQQHQHQPQSYQQSSQYIHNFKASPHFNGNVAIKNELTKFPNYAPIPQHAIPVEATKYVAYKQAQQQQQQQQVQGYVDLPNQQLHQQQFSLQGQAPISYAVYEDAENVAKTGGNFGINYQQPNNAAPAVEAPQQLSKAAEDYLHFMSTNEYFLPKHDPNYKQLDVERDQVKYQQQKLIEKKPPQQPHQPHQAHQQHQSHQPHQSNQLHQPVHVVSDTSASSSYNKPLRVSDLFYQQDPSPAANSAVVRGSYQAGQNSFVVKSDGNKSVKHILSNTLSSKALPPVTPSPAVTSYSQIWHKTETPEPLRFEFTEHDAIKGSASSYTNAPHGQKYYYETHPSTPHIPTVSVALASASAPAPVPIPEVGQPVQEVTVTLTKDNTEYANNSPKEKPVLDATLVSKDTKEAEKDPEAYCEKICANVYDENDEIVCGSDGYMYTGETQLQCYSSCLNIEVSIKSEGSCS